MIDDIHGKMPDSVTMNGKRKDKEDRSNKKIHQELFKSVQGLRMISPKLKAAVICKAMEYFAFFCVIRAMTTKKSDFKHTKHQKEVNNVGD